jgi:hypothetical protein
MLNGLSANRSHEKMREEVDRILAEAAAVDAGERRGTGTSSHRPAFAPNPRGIVRLAAGSRRRDALALCKRAR